MRQLTPRGFLYAQSVKHRVAYMGILKGSRNSSPPVLPNIHKFLLGMCQEEKGARKEP